VRIACEPDRWLAREGLLAMSVATGLQVMAAMMEAEVTEMAGPRGKHDPNRTVGRHGRARTSVTLGSRRVSVERLRAGAGYKRREPDHGQSPPWRNLADR
jgi:hypothetical protein